MQLRIVRETAYLRAELRARETPEQMREALTTLLSECRRSGIRRVLLSTRASRPLFRVQQFGLASFLEGMGAACRIALVSDNAELRAADEYVATMAQQRGVEVRAFRSEAAAAHWLQGGLQHAPSSGRRYRFNRIVIAGAPSAPGVYTLWQGEEVIYYGRAHGEATIRSRLLEHLEQPVGATHYSWEISREPAPLEKELLQQFKRAFGRLPRLNEAA
jgi:SpoIIAA-like